MLTHHLVLVAAQSQTFVETASHLAAKLTDTPLLLGTFNLVETAGIGILDAHQDEVVGSRKHEM